MRRSAARWIASGVLGGGANYTVNFAAGLGPFSGANLSIVGGRLVISPTLGAEMFGDPGLEGTYTAGKANVLTDSGPGGTFVQSADAHAGSRAQQWTASGTSQNYLYRAAGTQYNWYRMSAWGKRTAGTAGQVKMNTTSGGNVGWPQRATNSPNLLITSATWAQYRFNQIQSAASFLDVYGAIQSGTTGYDTVISDDFSKRAITYSTMLAFFTKNYGPNVNVKARLKMTCGCPAGVAARIDSTSNPQNSIELVHDGDATLCLLQKKAGVYTKVYENTALPYCEDAAIQLRVNGNTAQVFYNGVQIGADQAIDAALANYTNTAILSADADNSCASCELRPYIAITEPNETWKPVSGFIITNISGIMRTGDTLELKAGTTYTITGAPGITNIPSGSASVHTKIVGNGAIITGIAGQLVLSGKSFVEISGLTFQDMINYPFSLSNCHDFILSNVGLKNNSSIATQDGFILLNGSYNIQYISCTAGPLPSTISTCDGFECQDNVHDVTYTNCLAYTINNGATENDGHGFEVYNSAAGKECYNVTYNNCESYGCQIGFSNESTGAGGNNTAVQANSCNSHDQAAHDYQGLNNAIMLVHAPVGGVSYTGNVTEV